jgi:hypothetical protein
MNSTFSVPGIYSRPRARVAGFPRIRTDVVGMVGAAGPRHRGNAMAVNDWKSYIATFRQDENGDLLAATPGSTLESTVRDYFANGGRRLWIVNVPWTPGTDDPAAFMNTMLGIGDSAQPHGLELLLREDEVSIVVLPDLDATHVVQEDRFEAPPQPGDPCFVPCSRGGGATVPAVQSVVAVSVEERLFSNDDVMWAQRYVLSRVERTRWRWFVLLTPPPGSSTEAAIHWRERLSKATEGAEHGALYWPWLLTQDSPGAPVTTRSPLGAVAGVFAAVDLANGPHIAPANRPIIGAVAPDMPVNDIENGRAYDVGINVLRDFPGRGIELWGARTLRWRSRRDRGDVMAYVSPRRCLNAIARTAEHIGRPVVFEPNDAILRIRVHQIMTDYLLQVFASGALKGAVAEEGFFVAVEPVDGSQGAEIVTRIGVALAAPAEFIEIRIGRETGVIENAEAA